MDVDQNEEKINESINNPPYTISDINKPMDIDEIEEKKNESKQQHDDAANNDDNNLNDDNNSSLNIGFSQNESGPIRIKRVSLSMPKVLSTSDESPDKQYVHFFIQDRNTFV